MSVPTLAQTAFQIREGHSGRGGTSVRYIDGVVNGQAVVTAFESIALKCSDGSPQWLLMTYPDVAHFAGAEHPIALQVAEEDQARQWVSLFTALYAKAAEAVSL